MNTQRMIETSKTSLQKPSRFLNEHVQSVLDRLTFEHPEEPLDPGATVTIGKNPASEPAVYSDSSTPQPEGVRLVRDIDGDVWELAGEAWRYGTVAMSWKTLLGSVGPVTALPDEEQNETPEEDAGDGSYTVELPPEPADPTDWYVIDKTGERWESHEKYSGWVMRDGPDVAKWTQLIADYGPLTVHPKDGDQP